MCIFDCVCVKLVFLRRKYVTELGSYRQNGNRSVGNTVAIIGEMGIGESKIVELRVGKLGLPFSSVNGP